MSILFQPPVLKIRKPYATQRISWKWKRDSRTKKYVFEYKLHDPIGLCLRNLPYLHKGTKLQILQVCINFSGNTQTFSTLYSMVSIRKLCEDHFPVTSINYFSMLSYFSILENGGVENSCFMRKINWKLYLI